MSGRPSFINIGPGRCATSWMYEVLKSHPQIRMSSVKETEFFNTNFDRGHEWYERFFPSNSNVCGEISNNYYLDPIVADRILAYRSDMKIIVNVRRPLDLLRSYYQFGLRRGVPMKDWQQVVDLPIGMIMGSGYGHRLARQKTTTADQCSFLQSVCLADCLQPFLKKFPRSQVYVFIYERFRRESEAVLRELYEFLDVDPMHKPEVSESVVNAAIIPRSRWMARLATHTGFWLRSVGLYRLLSLLKESDTLKSIFFSNQKARQSESTLLESIPQEIVARLKEQELKLHELLPELQDWWSVIGPNVAIPSER